MRLPAVLPLVCLLAGALPPPLLAGDDSPVNPKPVRSTTRWGNDLIAEGSKRSPSFRRLVDRLRLTTVIVYVEPVRALPGKMWAVTNFLGLNTPYRYLRVSIGTAATRKRLISLIGHELQHANEIADAPEIVDPTSLASHYRRTGDDNPDGYDTPAARAMGQLVWNEIWRHVDADEGAPYEPTAAPPPGRKTARPAASVTRPPQ